ncbi:hypothetical protein Gorai_004407, partial [Gossypium raimondii]|nr:hypothetical protein [Gossypium raimondii]
PLPIENGIAGLSINEGEEEAWQLHEEDGLQKSLYEYYLIGCFLTASVFYRELDIDRVINGAPWMFNNHLLIFHRLKENDDLMQVPLVFSYFWVQIHDLPLRLFSKDIAKQFGNFFGAFVEYDAK